VGMSGPDGFTQDSLEVGLVGEDRVEDAVA
jgi:hypothetical protein